MENNKQKKNSSSNKQTIKKKDKVLKDKKTVNKKEVINKVVVEDVKKTKNKQSVDKVLDNKKTQNNSKTGKKNLKNKKKIVKNKKGKLKLRKFSLDIFDLLIVVVVTTIFACVCTGFILNYQYRKNNSLYEEGLVSDDNLSEFIKTYSEIVDNYYEEVDKKGMIEAAIEGMVNYLEDNYSIYLDRNATNDLSESLDGSYEGIGIVSMANIIYYVYDDSPADKAGLMVDDEIIKVNGQDIDDENYDKISELIKENKDNENEIVVKRDGKELSFKVSVETIVIDVTSTNVIKKEAGNIGYLKFTSFSANSYEQFNESLNELEEDDISSLIIDMRGNTGGYLDQAEEIANLFLSEGDVIYSLEKKGEIEEYKDDTEEKREYRIVVLVDGTTASAAEILASTLKDNYDAIIVGKTTYGKGKVQTLMHYDDTMIKYTSAKWLRSNGECIDEKGIEPDYDVDNIIKNKQIIDKQMDKAIELLS